MLINTIHLSEELLNCQIFNKCYLGLYNNSAKACLAQAGRDKANKKGHKVIQAYLYRGPFAMYRSLPYCSDQMRWSQGAFEFESQGFCPEKSP